MLDISVGGPLISGVLKINILKMFHAGTPDAKCHHCFHALVASALSLLPHCYLSPCNIFFLQYILVFLCEPSCGQLVTRTQTKQMVILIKSQLPSE